MKTLKKQFLFDLADIIDADGRIAKALPRMVKPDTSTELKEAILSLAKDTEGQVRKVEQLFECFGASATVKPDCNGVEGGRDLADEEALMFALRVVEQGDRPVNGSPREWVIASYDCLKEWTNQQGSAEGADFLEQILAEEEIARHRDRKEAI